MECFLLMAFSSSPTVRTTSSANFGSRLATLGFSPRYDLHTVEVCGQHQDLAANPILITRQGGGLYGGTRPRNFGKTVTLAGSFQLMSQPNGNFTILRGNAG